MRRADFEDPTADLPECTLTEDCYGDCLKCEKRYNAMVSAAEKQEEYL